MHGSERDDRHLRADDRECRPDAAEEGIAGLVRDEEREWCEYRGLMQDDVLRIEERDSRDKCEEAVPEREGVAGVQPAVRELVHSVERERVESLELAHTGEVEEAIATDLARHVPEQDAEHRAGAEQPPAAE